MQDHLETAMPPTSAMAARHSRVPTFRVLSVSATTPSCPVVKAEVLTSGSAEIYLSAPHHSAAAVPLMASVPVLATAMDASSAKLPASHMSSGTGATVGTPTLLNTSLQNKLQKEFFRAGESVEFVIGLQSLLHQLKAEKVRDDFRAGQIISTDRPDMVLLSLDIIGTLLFPNWSGAVLDRQRLQIQAAVHLQSLCSRSLFLLKLPETYAGLDEFPYAMWMEIILEIMSSKYWSFSQSVPVECVSQLTSSVMKETCAELLTSENSIFISKEEPPVGKYSGISRKKFSKRKQKFRESLEPYSGGSVPHDINTSQGFMQSPCACKCLCRQSGRQRKVKVTPLIIKDLEIQDSSSNSSSDSDSDIMDRKLRPRYPREAVDPGCFDVVGNESLKQFLSRYERYFNSTYEGSQRDCTRELARFISGELKDAYEALGGARVRYNRMREGLLRWYRTRRGSYSTRYKTEFEQTVMRSGESFVLYFMRLEGLALQAFSRDPAICVKKLIEKVFASTPGWFIECIEQKEEIKRMLKLGERATWGELLELAELKDNTQRKMQLRMLNQKTTEQRERVSSEQKESGREATLVGVRRCKIVRNSNYKKKVKSVQCYSCGEFGHIQAACTHPSGEMGGDWEQQISGNFSRGVLPIPCFNASKQFHKKSDASNLSDGSLLSHHNGWPSGGELNSEKDQMKAFHLNCQAL